MADEYGNLEVGLEILTSESENLPEIQTFNAVYVFTKELPTEDDWSQFNLPREDSNEMPAGYSIAGVKSIAQTTTAYQASTVSGKKNGNGLFKCEGDLINFENSIGQRTVPNFVQGLKTASTTTAGTYYMEITVTYVIVPYARVQEEGAVV